MKTARTRRHVRQKDLAEKLKLTQGTVSRALRGIAGVSPDLRERIVQAARETGYKLPVSFFAAPDVPARHGTVCVDIPHGDDWHERLIDGAIRAAREIGMEVIVAPRSDQRILPQVVQRKQVDGLIRLMHRTTAAGDKHAVPSPVPTVSVLFHLPDADVVSVDHFGSAYALGLHVGTFRPGIAACISYRDPIGRARFAGVRIGLEERGCAVPAELVRTCKSLEPVDVMPLVEELLDLRAAGQPEHQFDVMTFYNDLLALRAVDVIRARGLRVPDDIGIAGYDDVPLPTNPDIKLTTVHLPIEELGAAAVRRLNDRLRHPGVPPVHCLLDTRIVKGSSVVRRT